MSKMGKMKIGGDTVLVLSAEGGESKDGIVKEEAAPAGAGEAASEEGAAPPTGADKLESLPVSAEPTVASETTDVVEEKHCYDKKKSFFDSISCEAVERSKG